MGQLGHTAPRPSRRRRRGGGAPWYSASGRPHAYRRPPQLRLQLSNRFGREAAARALRRSAGRNSVAGGGILYSSCVRGAPPFPARRTSAPPAATARGARGDGTPSLGHHGDRAEAAGASPTSPFCIVGANRRQSAAASGDWTPCAARRSPATAVDVWQFWCRDHDGRVQLLPEKRRRPPPLWLVPASERPCQPSHPSPGAGDGTSRRTARVGAGATSRPVEEPGRRGDNRFRRANARVAGLTVTSASPVQYPPQSAAAARGRRCCPTGSARRAATLYSAATLRGGSQRGGANPASRAASSLPTAAEQPSRNRWRRTRQRGHDAGNAGSRPAPFSPDLPPALLSSAPGAGSASSAGRATARTGAMNLDGAWRRSTLVGRGPVRGAHRPCAGG